MLVWCQIIYQTLIYTLHYTIKPISKLELFTFWTNISLEITPRGRQILDACMKRSMLTLGVSTGMTLVSEANISALSSCPEDLLYNLYWNKQ